MGRRGAWVLVVGAVVIVTGCSSGIDRPSEPTSTASTSVPASSSASTPVRRSTLPGFGATRIAFRAEHPEAASSYDDCCFGPTVRSDGGTLVPTWNIASSQGDRVTFLVRNFPRGTTEAAATRLIESEDLPADARAVRSRVIDGGACRFTVYRSRTLARALSVDVFSLRLFSPTPAGAAPKYVSSSIEQAKLLTGDLDICTV